MANGGKLGEMRNRLKSFRADISFVSTMLGALFAAATLIHLIQTGWNVHLNWGFAHFVEFYRRALIPIVDTIQWPLRAALAALHFDLHIPQYVKDLHALGFVLAGIYVRAWVSDEKAKAQLTIATASEPLDMASELPERAAARWRRKMAERAVRMTWADYAVQTMYAIVLGATALSYAFWVATLGYVAFTRSEKQWEKIGPSFFEDGPDSYDRYERHRLARFRFRKLLQLTAATVVAVILFYVGNALAPQLD